MNTYANKFTTYRATSGWRNEGLWWELDLGAQFWIDEIFLYFNNQGEGASGSSVRNGGQRDLPFWSRMVGARPRAR